MNTSQQNRRVAIVGYNRIPFARANTAYTHASNQDMLTAALNGLVDRYKLQGILIGEVAAGAVLKHSKDFNLVRESVLGTALDPGTPAADIQQACATGMESAIYIANKIALGQIEVGIAGGVDSISNLPLMTSEPLRKALLAARRQKSFLGKVKEFLKVKLKDLSPVIAGTDEPRTGLSMGGHTEVMAKYYHISRQEQDQLSLESHQKMIAAYKEGFYADLITPYLGLDRDNNARADTNLEKLAKLKTVYDTSVNGTLTAGNSTPLTDGASTILLASEAWAKEHNLPVIAYITHVEVAGIEFVQQRQNLLLAPVYAATRMLQKANMKLEDFDFFEIHEAFAAQALATMKIWESKELMATFGFNEALGKIDRSKLNVKGGSLAAAHPFAATGGRVIATMAKLLNQKGKGKGLISVCAAGGLGVTMIVEKP
ncbi:acetyl-CoA C-acetyltransferase [Pseudochryseolinea flava]|uniref:Acetyl-CoA C-acetyltransferase n=1 Tax=Pseudochryseolinea flava TaxID=2059302 RepID=A0A364Y1B1_9BACT|nr:acetyl-CoA C-acetyltransferase [Pseudochryseolinea flava]RAW00518.1 acetyl-CoA C-acetyltransferase [Pseudochryseolinea flava]